MMRVLVTGAAGFLGRHLVGALLREGHTVVGVDNFITSDRADLAPLAATPGFQFAEVDITDPAFRHYAARFAFDQVYNLACPTGVPNNGPLALEMLTTSYEGSKAALEIARANGAPTLVTSSAEVYGNPKVVPQPETYHGDVDTLGGRKGYENGKRVAETLYGIYAERFGVPAKIVRVFNTYGPGLCLDDTRVIPAFVRASLEGRPLLIHGAGLQTRCYTYVDDMVAGLRLVMERGAPARPYNIGSEIPVSVRDLATEIVRLTGGAGEVRHIERPSHDHDTHMPDTTRVRTELGWAMTVGLEAGLRATIRDFEQRLGLAAVERVA
ncbi:MAG: NAD-dependent epimerase/dehydratase family protein [Dehalococcoidia bacterium]